ncbi:MAG: hypothetical protein CVV64_07360 [Candidatus Wallbacteria bacterium HGW-Wallbacteria-1]|jgi:hypothetical protein|uniref:Uncharacterized protein n=1 Tax=Candidatus Wallbacteria bacterium HGW-Wallbacteria-1 TaxID=2013854 RepID=A0A2N1PR01_9BACT|nr:MAG: hypothetical protein CVV64_07360 [Candidatus Wallbacteria bacterium HGW-Wallbacteria-1]
MKRSMMILIIAGLLTSHYVQAQTLLNKYKKTGNANNESTTVGQTEKSIPDLIQIPDASTRLPRKEFEKVLEEPFKLTYQKKNNARHAYLDMDFLLVFHPRMARYLPELGCFVKSIDNENISRMRERIMAALVELNSEEKSETPEIKTLNREVAELERNIEKLRPEMNREFEEASRKFKFTDSEGNAPSPEELAKLQDDYQSRLREISSNYRKKEDSIRIRLQEKTSHRQSLEAERLSGVFTTPSETAAQFMAMINDIESIVEEYCAKSGHELVFNGALRKAVQHISAPADPKNRAAKKRPEWSETKTALYAEFLEKPEILRVEDSGHLTAYTEALKDWYYENSRIRDRMAALRINPFILAGAQDITREISYLLLKKYSLPAEKNQMIIDLYNRLQQEIE